MHSRYAIAISALTILLLAAGAFFARPLFQKEPVQAGSALPNSETTEDDDSTMSTFAPSVTGNAAEEEPSSRNLVQDSRAENAQATPIIDALEENTPIVEAINEMALKGQWGYDQKARNLALWESLCLAGEERLSSLINEEGSPSDIRTGLDTLCKDFQTVKQEIDDFIRVEIDERESGSNDRARLEQSLEDMGPDAATVFAISELSKALQSFDYAKALDVVWFLGVYDFSATSSEFSLYSRTPTVPTILAVSASLFCTYVGGCGREHPVSLHLCLQFPERPCSKNPVDIYDAIGQVLTGAELETFNTMQRSILRLLNRYHRGDL